MSELQKKWLDKPYHSLDYDFKTVYGEKVYKIALEAGMTCPNRDGKIDTRGCIFCSDGGSGEFASKVSSSISCQLNEGKKLFTSGKKTGSKYVAYFQSYTNTYAPVEYLEKIYAEALSEEEVVGISIATRADCIPNAVIDLLSKLKSTFPDKFIWVELGLQTIHASTIQYIRRGYDQSVFENAVKNLNSINIPVIVHVILGLPGETKDMMLDSCKYLNSIPVSGVKLQLLHVLKGTDLETEYKNGKFDVLSLEDYVNIVILCIENLSPDITIHRLTGDGAKDLLIAPIWSLNKRNVLNTLLKEMRNRNTWQGKQFSMDAR